MWMTLIGASVPGVALLGAAFAGWKAIPKQKLRLAVDSRRSRALQARRTKACQAIWAQMPGDVMTVSAVAEFHHSHRGVYEYA
jgi:hypothetical protein